MTKNIHLVCLISYDCRISLFFKRTKNKQKQQKTCSRIIWEKSCFFNPFRDILAVSWDTRWIWNWFVFLLLSIWYLKFWCISHLEDSVHNCLVFKKWLSFENASVNFKLYDFLLKKRKETTTVFASVCRIPSIQPIFI